MIENADVRRECVSVTSRWRNARAARSYRGRSVVVVAVIDGEDDNKGWLALSGMLFAEVTVFVVSVVVAVGIVDVKSKAKDHLRLSACQCHSKVARLRVTGLPFPDTVKKITAA